MNRLHRIGDWLCDAATPRFGQISTWILLSFAVVVAFVPIEFDVGPAQSHFFFAVFGAASFCPHQPAVIHRRADRVVGVGVAVGGKQIYTRLMLVNRVCVRH